MSRAFADEQTIVAPRDSVWDTLTDWSRAPGWMPGVDAMRGSGPPAAGTQLTFTARGKERTARVTTCTPPSSLTTESTLGGVTATYRYVLTSVDATTTRAALTVDVVTTGLMRLLGPVIRSAIAREDGVQLAQLKRLVERESAGQGPPTGAP